MRFCSISDTHGYKVEIDKVDCLIHTGDVGSVRRFANWFRSLDIEYKIFIPGNHDKLMETGHGQRMFEYLLMGEEIVINGIKIWGSPVTPCGSFMMPRPCKHWDEIPLDARIVATHGPPYGHGDNVRGRLAGCLSLLNRLKIVQPEYHLCGHIHEGYGITTSDEMRTVFINSSHVNARMEPVNAPIYFEVL